MGTILQDVRFALRNLRRTPAFPLAAIATLALGVGATTAIFSTVNAALLRPLPYPHAGDLYSVRTTLTDGRVTTGLVSPVELLRLNAPNLSIERAAGLQAQEVTLIRDDGTAQTVALNAVSEGFFEVFGLPMTLGGLTHDAFVRNGPPQIVISHRVWHDLYQSDPAIVGKAIRFQELTTTIGGVASPGFDTPHNSDFWAGINLPPTGVAHSFEGFMRLKPGTSLERATSEMSGVMATVARDYPASAKSRIYVVKPLVEQIVGDLGPILLIVLAATALLLMLACVNVTNLLLARGASRAREIAVRISLGAGRGRIVRQLLTESLLLATAGALVGLGLAYAGVRVLLRIGAAKLPRLDAVPFDANVLLFALGALALCGVVVGFAPALRLAATDMKTLMNESGRSGGAGRGTARWLSAMTISEIALAIMLVAGAGWLIRGFAMLRATDAGFVPAGRVFFDITLPNYKFQDTAAMLEGFRELSGRLRELPGVTHVASTFNFPLRATPENSLFVLPEGQSFNEARPLNSRQRIVGVGFFDAMGIKLLAGRDFNADDREGSTQVAIVNRAFARRYLEGRDPLNVRFSSGYPAIDPRVVLTIVGVVEDVRQRTLTEPGEPAYYSAHGQQPARRQTMVVATSLRDTSTLQGAIREEVRKTDPQIAIEPMDVSSLVGDTLRRQELGMTLMLMFGVVAVVLAAIGIYGVIAYATAQRTAEVATRLALGASPGSVFGLVLRQGRTLVSAGAAIGLVLAYVAGRLVSAQLYAVSAADPLILGGAATLVVAIAIAATMIPAFRASRLDPARVLRPE